MIQLVQPQNRERDIKLALDGYRSFIKHDSWFVEAFQKDLIQNSWGARQDKKHGKGWGCKITLDSAMFDGKGCVIALDSGTKGLTGRIPRDQIDLLQILKDRQTSDRLAFFLSSQWSEHEIGTGGSRGRGKMLSLAASNEFRFYFESFRSDDNKYIFGEMFLDNNDKEIRENFEIDDNARKKFKEKFPNLISLENYGTRIFIPNPRSDLKKSFGDFTISNFISRIWWEILEKFDAKIYVKVNDKETKVLKSDWLPPSKVTAKYKEYPTITIKDGLKIKRITLGFLGDKDIPDNYKGIHIQRAGMIIETINLYDLTQEDWNNKIYGIVEFEPDLEEAMLEHEGVEHYNFFWTHNPPRQVRQVIYQKVFEFAKENGLLGETPAQVKTVKEAESNAEKILNKLAKKLNLSGLSMRTKNRSISERGDQEKIRLSIKDFQLPSHTGRVNFGEEIQGTYVIPINDYNYSLKVLVRTYIFDENGRTIVSKEEEKSIDNNIHDLKQVSVGWEKVTIDEKKFPQGSYTFKAEMFSMQEVNLDSLKIEKAEKIYHPVSRKFWVEQDPEEGGFFDIRRSDREEKEKFFWWQNEGSEDRDFYVLYWNGNHPIFNEVVADKNSLERSLINFGSLAAYSIVYSKAKQNENNFKNIFRPEELHFDNLENISKVLIEKWGVFLATN